MSDQALCVRLWDFSETSQTVSLFTREHGMLRGLAKGAKRQDARFSGGFDLLTRGEVQAIIKPSGALATITAWDLLQVFPSLRARLKCHLAAMAAADVLHHSMREQDPHPELFDASLQMLEALEEGVAPVIASVELAAATLTAMGSRPELNQDVSQSGQELPPAGTYGFAPRLGGLLRDPGPDADPHAVWRVRAETVSFLRSALAGDRASLLSASEATRLRGLRLLWDYLSHTIGQRPTACDAFIDSFRSFPQPDGEV